MQILGYVLSRVRFINSLSMTHKIIENDNENENKVCERGTIFLDLYQLAG